MAIVIYPSNFFGTNTIRVAVTLIITRKNSAKTKVRGKFANAIHTLERSIIGHPLSVQLRLHFLHSLSVADKKSGLITIKLTCYTYSEIRITQRNTSAVIQIYSALNQLRFLKL